MNTIDVLLIYPPYTYPKKSPPIGLGYIAAVLEKEGYSVKIADMSVSGINYGGLAKEVQRSKPKIVGISFMTNQYQEAIKASQVIKQVDTNIPVIVGGPHVSALPKEILAWESVDIAVIGEGEITTLEVVNHFLKKERRVLEAIKGIGYKKEGEMHINPSREVIEDLDTLPFLAWHLLPVDKYAVSATGGQATERVFAIISSRGCPNYCIFCDSHTVFGRKFRGRSAQNIFDELVYLNKKFDATQFDFVDDTITVDKNRMYELCHLILDSNYRFKWMCNARVNTVTPEMLDLMKKAGCVRIEFGVESGDREVLKRLRKGITLGQIKTAHQFARDVGLSIGSFAMVGNVGEDMESVKMTKNLLQDIETDDIYIAIATPFPGTELYQIAKSNNWLLTHDWSKYVTSPTYLTGHRPIMRTDKMSAEEILKAFFYLHSQFMKKKFQTRYGKFFILNKRFYKETVFNIRSWEDIKHKAKIAKRLLGNYF